MYRKLFKTGNSVVVALPKEYLKDLGLKSGEKVSLELDRQKKQLLITPVERVPALPGVDAVFSRQVSEFIDLYRPALEDLAK